VSTICVKPGGVAVQNLSRLRAVDRSKLNRSAVLKYEVLLLHWSRIVEVLSPEMLKRGDVDELRRAIEVLEFMSEDELVPSRRELFI
jgi:hypothetical protein